MLKIIPPSNCPSCDSILEWSNNQLYCTNPDCNAVMSKKVLHFASTMKIKGMGPAALNKLKLTSIKDIYSLTEEEIMFLLKSEKLGAKLYYEIENSKKAPLNQLLPAFGIPLVGKTAAEKLSTVCESIYDITDETCRRAGLGPKVTDNLLDWLVSEFPLLQDLPLNFKFSHASKGEIKGVVCISGKLNSFKTKAEAHEALKEAGYEVKDSFSKQVTILVNESGIESTKTKQARTSGVTIVTNLKDLLEN